MTLLIIFSVNQCRIYSSGLFQTKKDASLIPNILYVYAVSSGSKNKNINAALKNFGEL